MSVRQVIRQRHIHLIETTLEIMDNILKNVSQERATTLRDGEDGWTVLEVVCHLRDFDRIFHERAVMIVSQEYPQLPAYDHEAMAIENNYNSQNLKVVYNELAESRERFVGFFEDLTEDQWERAGVHPERGHFTLLDAIMQVTTHDTNHIEQMTRILCQS